MNLVGPTIYMRTVTAFAGVAILLYAFIWESD